MAENLWDLLDPTERRFVSLAVRGYSNRQVATKCGTTSKYVSKMLCYARAKLRITGESSRSLTHWYWTAGPGYDETRMACLQDALREMTLTAAAVKQFHMRIVAQYEAPQGKKAAPS